MVRFCILGYSPVGNKTCLYNYVIIVTNLYNFSLKSENLQPSKIEEKVKQVRCLTVITLICLIYL